MVAGKLCNLQGNKRHWKAPSPLGINHDQASEVRKEYEFQCICT